MQGFDEVFVALKAIVQRHTAGYEIVSDEPGKYYVALPSLNACKPVWFGGVEIKKNYVSFHLMPVYCCPGLLQEISTQLRTRMQGKSCFNFRTIDLQLFSELDSLVAAGKLQFEQIDFGAAKSASR
jgi:hypothetical protein